MQTDKSPQAQSPVKRSKTKGQSDITKTPRRAKAVQKVVPVPVKEPEVPDTKEQEATPIAPPPLSQSWVQSTAGQHPYLVVGTTGSICFLGGLFVRRFPQLSAGLAAGVLVGCYLTGVLSKSTSENSEDSHDHDTQ